MCIGQVPGLTNESIFAGIFLGSDVRDLKRQITIATAGTTVTVTGGVY